MTFVTQFDKKRKKYESVAGDPFLTTYEYRIDKEGVKSLEPVGKKNIQDMIDASLESTDLNILLQRFFNGETDALDRVRGVYADVRDMPSSYAELFDRNEQCRQMFEKLPADIKARFNNSYTQFWSSYGSETFMKAINPEFGIAKESEVVPDESN